MFKFNSQVKISKIQSWPKLLPINTVKIAKVNLYELKKLCRQVPLYSFKPVKIDLNRVYVSNFRFYFTKKRSVKKFQNLKNFIFKLL